MSMVLGGIAVIATTMSVCYLGKKGWHALHTAVGITPGVLIYRDANTPLSLATLTWQQLSLNSKHLSMLPDNQLRQLQRIDHKVVAYHHYQQGLQAQHKTPALTEQQFVLHKLLHTRLAEILASHYHLSRLRVNRLGVHGLGVNGRSDTTTHTTKDDQGAEAGQLLQEVLNNIEGRLDKLVAQVDTQHLQDLRVMKKYIDSHHH